jgi:ligand-binding sensor domain-containing protein
MFRHTLLFCICLSVSIFAQKTPTKKAGGADSVSHEKPTEWRQFASDAPVKAFCLQGDVLWYATDAAVFSSNMKKADSEKFTQLGKISGTDIKALVTDNSGKVWMGGKNGIAVKSGTQFTNYTKSNGLPDDAVNAMAVTPNGSVWVGTDNGAAVFQGNSWTVYTTKEGLTSDKIQVITVDSNGKPWLGTDRGISVYTGSGFTKHSMQNGMSWNDVKALTTDFKKGVIWAAVGEKDVNCFENNEWKTFMDIQPEITSIMADSHSRIWFGSTSGLLKFNGEEWTTDPNQIGIPAAQVFAMYKDKGGNLWYGMERGVLRLSNPYPF